MVQFVNLHSFVSIFVGVNCSRKPLSPPLADRQASLLPASRQQQPGQPQQQNRQPVDIESLFFEAIDFLNLSGT
jgi:hypothetical protein